MTNHNMQTNAKVQPASASVQTTPFAAAMLRAINNAAKQIETSRVTLICAHDSLIEVMDAINQGHDLPIRSIELTLMQINEALENLAEDF